MKKRKYVNAKRRELDNKGKKFVIMKKGKH